MRPLCMDDVLSQDHALVEVIDGAILVFERADKSSPENNAHMYYTHKYNTMLVEAVQNPDGFGTPLTERFAPVQGEISQVEFFAMRKMLNEGNKCIWRASYFISTSFTSSILR